MAIVHVSGLYVVVLYFGHNLVVTLHSRRGAKYCDEHVCLSADISQKPYG